MASPIWVARFVLLCVELVLITLLVLPLPSAVRRCLARAAHRLRASAELVFLLRFTALGLLLAIFDSYNTLARLARRADPLLLPASAPAPSLPAPAADLAAPAGFMQASIDRQRKFRAERNGYLCLFALVLMYAIRRILELIMEAVLLEDETADLRARLQHKTPADPSPQNKPRDAERLTKAAAHGKDIEMEDRANNSKATSRNILERKQGQTTETKKDL